MQYSVYNSAEDLYIKYEFNDLVSVLAFTIKTYYILKQLYLSNEYSSLKMKRVL